MVSIDMKQKLNFHNFINLFNIYFLINYFCQFDVFLYHKGINVAGQYLSGLLYSLSN